MTELRSPLLLGEDEKARELMDIKHDRNSTTATVVLTPDPDATSQHHAASMEAPGAESVFDLFSSPASSPFSSLYSSSRVGFLHQHKDKAFVSLTAPRTPSPAEYENEDTLLLYLTLGLTGQMSPPAPAPVTAAADSAPSARGGILRCSPLGLGWGICVLCICFVSVFYYPVTHQTSTGGEAFQAGYGAYEAAQLVSTVFCLWYVLTPMYTRHWRLLRDLRFALVRVSSAQGMVTPPPPSSSWVSFRLSTALRGVATAIACGLALKISVMLVLNIAWTAPRDEDAGVILYTVLTIFSSVFKKMLIAAFVLVHSVASLTVYVYVRQVSGLLQLRGGGSPKEVGAAIVGASHVVDGFIELVQRHNTWFGRAVAPPIVYYVVETFFTLLQVANVQDGNPRWFMFMLLVYAVLDLCLSLPLLLLPLALITSALNGIVLDVNRMMPMARVRQRRGGIKDTHTSEDAEWIATASPLEHDHEAEVLVQGFLGRLRALQSSLRATALGVPISFSLVGQLYYLFLGGVVVLVRLLFSLSEG